MRTPIGETAAEVRRFVEKPTPAMAESAEPQPDMS
jgi:hypothetical protein